ncbi:MAG: DUF4166 domain-containing protein [Caulobacteraceae bacterium]|nr:MAG: DUF4166 domain-containing protein [Caulobacteraceae bacterium]
MGTLAGWIGGHGIRPARPRGRLATPRRLDFRRLVGEAAWSRLPLAVRERFGVHRIGEEITYPGEMVVRASRPGRWLAQACRLIGTPLAPWTGEAVSMRVVVRMEERGVVWDRYYRFPGRPEMLVTSRKQLGQAGELLEVARGGLGMRSEVTVEDGALHFRGRGYVWVAGPLVVPLPSLLTPGAAHVVHEDLGGGRFRFTMRFTHPWFGETIFQQGVFADP